MNPDTLRLDDYFTKHYKELQKLALRISRQDKELSDDILHQTYLNVRSTVDRKGFVGDNFRNYISTSMSHLYYFKKNGKNNHLPLDNQYSILDQTNLHEDYTHVRNFDNYFIDDYTLKVLRDEEFDKEEMERFNEFKKEIYEYVDANYNLIEATFFKYRYKNGYTFEKCAEKSSQGNYNYSKAKIFQIIKKINEDLRIKFKLKKDMRFRTLCQSIKAKIQQNCLQITDTRVRAKYAKETIAKYTDLVENRSFDSSKETLEEYENKFFNELKEFEKTLN